MTDGSGFTILFGVVAGLGFATLWFFVPWWERGRDTIEPSGGTH